MSHFYRYDLHIEIDFACPMISKSEFSEIIPVSISDFERCSKAISDYYLYRNIHLQVCYIK